MDCDLEGVEHDVVEVLSWHLPLGATNSIKNW
jgi:hypothetical protein